MREQFDNMRGMVKDLKDLKTQRQQLQKTANGLAISKTQMERNAYVAASKEVEHITIEPKPFKRKKGEEAAEPEAPVEPEIVTRPKWTNDEQRLKRRDELLSENASYQGTVARIDEMNDRLADLQIRIEALEQLTKIGLAEAAYESRQSIVLADKVVVLKEE